MCWILNILVFNLVMVFILELIPAWLFGSRTTQKFITVLLSNIITNPLVVISRLSMTLFLPEWEPAGIIVLEIMAVLIEGFIFSKYNVFEKKNPYIISIILNLISFLPGELINLFI